MLEDRVGDVDTAPDAFVGVELPAMFELAVLLLIGAATHDRIVQPRGNTQAARAIIGPVNADLGVLGRPQSGSGDSIAAQLVDVMPSCGIIRASQSRRRRDGK